MIIRVLLVIMAVLAATSGFSALLGGSKRYRISTFWYMLAALSSSVWAFSIRTFLSLTEENASFAPTVVAAIYVSGAIIVLGLFGHNSWNFSSGRVLSVLIAIATTILCTMVIVSPELLYDGITISPDGNSVHLLGDQPFYICYVAYFVLVMVIFSIYMIIDLARSKRGRRGYKRGDIVFFIGMTITCGMSLIFDLLLPPFDYSLIWVGPLAMTGVAVGFYYLLIRKRITTISTWNMVALSYLILASIGSMIYLVIFYTIFTALFKGQEPSLQVIVLNFIMFLIIILAMPSVREITSSILSLISIDKVDISYITKKLNRFAASSKKNYSELAEFLADHLHFTYLGFIIDGKLYDSSPHQDISPADLEKISSIPPSKTLWQIPRSSVQLVLNKYNINAVAPLGRPSRQILIGKPLGKKSLRKSDLTEIETIINLVAAIL